MSDNIYMRLLDRVEATKGSSVLLMTRAERTELVAYLSRLGVLRFAQMEGYPDQFAGRLVVIEEKEN